MENLIVGIWFIGFIFFSGVFVAFTETEEGIRGAIFISLVWPISLVALFGGWIGFQAKRIIDARN